jgi:hypothetical protein
LFLFRASGIGFLLVSLASAFFYKQAPMRSSAEQRKSNSSKDLTDPEAAEGQEGGASKALLIK